MTENLLSAFKMETPPKRWLRMHLEHQEREFCLIWPFTRAQNGYPIAGRGSRIRPHRIMCEKRHGPPPSPTHQAAHSCGNGHLGCVNPWHLNWRTAGENQCERYKQSGLVPRAKLTPTQVDEIRSLQGRERTVDIAARFGVSEANIRQIQSGKTWTKESQRHRPFNSDEVIMIRRSSSKTEKQLAAEFGVRRGVIGKIRRKETYQWVTQD